jgi:hypothetical protein
LEEVAVETGKCWLAEVKKSWHELVSLSSMLREESLLISYLVCENEQKIFLKVQVGYE